jgi:hypothetical protein
VPRESGTDGSGGALNDGSAVVVVLGLEPVRPALLLAMPGASVLNRDNSPTEALVAPPLRSQGFGGDGDDMFIFSVAPPHPTSMRRCVDAMMTRVLLSMLG